MPINRRYALTTLLSAASMPLVGQCQCAADSMPEETGEAPAKKAAPAFELIDIQTIGQPADRYYGWPTVTRRANGQLIVVASGGRKAHVCPFGRVDLIQSLNDGDTWTYARTILDGPIDDRDAGIVETSKGTLLVSTFTSLAYVPTLHRAVDSAHTDQPVMPAEILHAWQSVHSRIPDGEHEKFLGCWLIRSDDDGVNWSPAYRCPVNAPHGPVNLSDGSLLYAGKMLWEDPNKVGVCRSADDGQTWQWLADIPTRPGDNHREYHELHAVEAADGRLIVHIRNHNKPNAGETLQTHSSDGGKTWEIPYSIGVWGLPSHLLRLRSGRLLMSYGHRRAPLGNQVRLSDDNGLSWSAAIVLYGEGASGDLGYPSTVELENGTLLTVWYEKMAATSMSQLRAARWKLL